MIVKSRTKKDILFFHTSLTNCAVHTVWEMLKRKEIVLSRFFIRKFNYLLMDYLKNKYSDFIKNDKQSKVVVMGHRDFEYPVLQSTEKNKFFGPEWFDKKTTKSIGVFFVPGGAEMLRSPSWDGTFNSWVSFKEKFDFLTGLSISEKESERMFPKFFDTIYKQENSDDIIKEFDKVIDQSINHISLKYDCEDMVLTVFKLRINKANLTHNMSSK